MPKEALLMLVILFFSFLIYNSYGSLGGDLPQQTFFPSKNKIFEQKSDLIQLSAITEQQPIKKRYLIFGSDVIQENEPNHNFLYTVNSRNGFFSVGVLQESEAASLKEKGYFVLEDFLLDFYSQQNKPEKVNEISRIGEIVGSDYVHQHYNYTGKGIKIAVVDTGADFSNPDIQQSLARDENNNPVMLDADGQGIILTNATFIANIDKYGILRNYTKTLPENVTSSVYIKREGIFLDISKNGKGTVIPVYNSFFPLSGNSPIFSGTLSDDWKIGRNNREYIISKSGLYHLGVMYQGFLQDSTIRVQVVPVLVVDSKLAGVYDTIIPDMSSSWEDFTRFELKSAQKPNYDFDFTDETPIRLGEGKEFLLYDFDKDGKFDYSAGTVGARVVDVYGVIEKKKSAIDKTVNALNGTLLPPLDPHGRFFGVMSDFIGHGTASTASIASKGIQQYDIYNNTKKYTIKGVAPDAKIIPVKALWFGDSVYAWLWASGFNNVENKWTFDGKPRADIISNSWGVANFPSLESAPGMDPLSLILNILTTPKSLDDKYPGVTIVTSAGNSGHGYGTLGLPATASYGITVGATTNNVFVGYGSFKGQPRFGNTTNHANEIADFSSRGPGIIGDPKPDLMSIGAYSFTPSSVTKMKKDSKQESFSLFGGTSMAAPLVSGTVALLMQGLNEKSENYDPFRIKNILMSTATDLDSDPFTQGAGLVNATTALNFVRGDSGVFVVYNNSTFSNIKKILDIPIDKLNSNVLGIDKFKIPDKNYPQTSWFAGHLLPGDRSTTTFTIENPSDKKLNIEIKPQTFQLIKKIQFNGTTEVRIHDSILNKSDIYIPNYIGLDVKKHGNLTSYFNETNPIPVDASLMVLNVNFPFNEFMNKTDKIYANDLRISSLYLYDWNDKNNNTKIESDELSMVNRGGSWGTVQEIRVSEPKTKFANTPVVGIYPVPTRFSYWFGDTKQNATSMNYELAISYYKKDSWNLIWTSTEKAEVDPKNSTTLTATIVVPEDYQPGTYQGFLAFKGDKHTANVPVSYVVKKKVERDKLVVIEGTQNNNVLYGNGYVKGAFDMVNRYMSGEWRQYHFQIGDKKINAAAIEISWKNDDTNLAAFVIDPKGRIVQTNVPSGVFGHFLGWPSLDWLGTTSFSEGGGFFPVKNKDNTSTVLYAPINQTGTYILMVHSTLFDGKSITEPISVSAKFTTIVPDDKEPEIILSIPENINKTFVIPPQISDKNLDFVKYYLDNKEIKLNSTTNTLDSKLLTSGSHELKIFAGDIVGNDITKTFSFNVLTESPTTVISPSETIVGQPETIAVEQEKIQDKNNYLIIGIAIGIAIGATSIFLATKKIRASPKS